MNSLPYSFLSICTCSGSLSLSPYLPCSLSLSLVFSSCLCFSLSVCLSISLPVALFLSVSLSIPPLSLLPHYSDSPIIALDSCSLLCHVFIFCCCHDSTQLRLFLLSASSIPVLTQHGHGRLENNPHLLSLNPKLNWKTPNLSGKLMWPKQLENTHFQRVI